MKLINNTGGGSCLFKAISQALNNGSDYLHQIIRNDVCKFMICNRTFFCKFMESFEDYVNDMMKEVTFGDEACIVSMSEMFKLNIVVYKQISNDKICKFEYGETGRPKVSLYLRNYHYSLCIFANGLK